MRGNEEQQGIVQAGPIAASRTGSVAMPGLFLVALFGVIATLSLRGSGSNESAPAPRRMLQSWDTVALFGPDSFPTPTGSFTTYVESLPITADPEARYELRVQKGDSTGAHVPFVHDIYFNGNRVIGDNLPDFITYRVVEPTDTNTIRIDVEGDAGDFLKVALLVQPSASFTIHGPVTFVKQSGGLEVFPIDSFLLPPGAKPPFRIHAINGNPDGTLKVDSARVAVNETNLLNRNNFNANTGSFVREFSSLDSLNEMHTRLIGPAGRRITYRILATDSTAPDLTVDTPNDSITVAMDSVLVSGTVADETVVRLAIDGNDVTIGSGGSFSAYAQLSEGANTISIVATNGAGLVTTVNRHVTVDTQTPVIVVAAPVDGLVTNQASVAASGTVSDLSIASVSANGVPLTLVGTSFSGNVSLSHGLNIITFMATDTVGNNSAVILQVTRDTIPPVLTVTTPTDGDSTAVESITVAGTVSDGTSVSVSANLVPLTVTGDTAFSGNITVAEGTHPLIVRATDTAGNVTADTLSITFTGVSLPPDPATVAPAPDPTVATTLFESTRFLYEGPDSIQRGVTAGAIEAHQAAVIRGRVFDESGQALPGVRIAVLGQPEYGWTRTRADGRFDLAVNGNDRTIVTYSKSGFVPAQRTVEARRQEFASAADVALQPYDTTSTSVNLSGGMQVAQGSSVSDTSGTRQTTVVFKSGTTAELVFDNDSTLPVTNITVRATELSVGPMGPLATSGSLPETVGYVYGVELSIDEAVAAGATSVEFGQPIALYVENFVGFAVGSGVPLASYDPNQGVWMPAPDGRIIKIVSITAGIADIDVTGDGVADDSTTLADLGIDDAERTHLASLYGAGQTLMRVQVTHFSSWWCTWPYTTPADARYPVLTQSTSSPEDCPNTASGSIIECENQALGERLDVVGTPYTLNYRSKRTAGYKWPRSLGVAVSEPSIPASLKRIDLEIQIAGQVHVQSFSPSTNLTTNFTWDGKDVYGRPVQGGREIVIRVGYVYDYTYTRPPTWPITASFGLPSNATLQHSFVRYPPEKILWHVWRDTLQVWNEAATGNLAGWTLDQHHTYDPVAQILHFGDGEQLSSAKMGAIITNAVGSGDYCDNWTNFATDCGDGVPAEEAKLNFPEGMVVAPDGTLYFSEWFTNRVRKVDPSGIVSTVAGSDYYCDAINDYPSCGDGGPATQADIGSPEGLALDAAGNLYIADPAYDVIRMVDTAGIITTVAGGVGIDNSIASHVEPCVLSNCGDGGPAIEAELHEPNGVSVGPDGSLYIADTWNLRIRRVDPSGTIATIDSAAGLVRWVNAASDGSVYYGVPGYGFLGTASGNQIHRISPSGEITVVAGLGGQCSQTGICPPKNDGGDALQAFFRAYGMAITTDGRILILDTEYYALRHVATDGIIQTIAGDGVYCDVYSAPNWPGCGDGGPAAAASLTSPSALAVAPDGSIYISDVDIYRIRKVSTALPAFTTADIAIASPDGSELYQFDANGRHLRTRNTRTGSIEYEMAYDSAGRLTAITDRDGLATTVERDGAGTPTGILGPYGQRTELGVDGSGLLATVVSPAGDSTTMVTTATGLVTSMTNARGNTWSFTYDSTGVLTRDDDPAGGYQTLARTDSANAYSVLRSTALGRDTRYDVEQLSIGGWERKSTDPAGLTTVDRFQGGDSTRTVLPDGTVLTSVTAPDPRFGIHTMLPTIATITLPSSLQLSLTAGRHPTLSDSTNPLSLNTQFDSAIVNGQKYTSSYAQSNRTYTHTTPTGRVTTERLDSLGRIVNDSVAGFLPWTYSYDSSGRLSQAQQGSRAFEYTYDTLGRLETVTDPLDQVTEFEYDAAGRLTRQVLPDTNEIAFAWDRNGNLTSLTPPGRPAHTFTYDAVDQMASYTAPDLGSGSSTTEYTFDLDRRLTSILRPDSSEITMAYDSAGRISTVTIPRGSYGYSYSSTTGQLTGISSPDSVDLAYTYDGALVIGVEWSGQVNGTVDVTYDNNFRVVKQVVNGTDSVAYQYDNDGLTTAAGALTMTRNSANGLLTGTTLGSVTTSQTYDAFGDLATYTASYSGNTLFQTTYTRDAFGRLTRVIETIQGATDTLDYSYDLVGRLTGVDRNGVTVESYTYDANGNRTSFTGLSGTVTATYDDQDRLLTYGTTTFEYDETGTLAAELMGSDTTTYSYDEMGSLLEVTLPGGMQVEYNTDGQDRRVTRAVDGQPRDMLLYGDQVRVIGQLDSVGNMVSRFTYIGDSYVPSYLVKNGTTYRVVADHLGSVRLVIDVATGVVAQRIDYDSFGRTIQDTQPGFQPFAFAGGLMDNATNRIRFGHRDYDPATGRWTARDPIGFAAGGPNLYEYAHGDPVNFVDPTGMRPLPPCAIETLERLGIPRSVSEAIDLHEESWLPKLLNMGAVTLGNDVYTRNRIAFSSDAHMALIAHEAYHVYAISASSSAQFYTMYVRDALFAVVGTLFRPFGEEGYRKQGFVDAVRNLMPQERWAEAFEVWVRNLFVTGRCPNQCK